MKDLCMDGSFCVMNLSSYIASDGNRLQIVARVSSIQSAVDMCTKVKPPKDLPPLLKS